MRVAVIGTSGSGKTTFSRRLACAVGARHIELDAINWTPNWIDLNTHAPEDFRAKVASAIMGEHWICDGNYAAVRDLVLKRADRLVWLDPPKSTVMRQVISRSWVRAVRGDELWPGTGNRERFSRWLKKDHPIRWAYDTYEGRRQRYEQLFEDPELLTLRKWRVQTRKEADVLIRTWTREASLKAPTSSSPGR